MRKGKYDEEKVKWKLIKEDPNQISRLKGLIKYKILGIFRNVSFEEQMKEQDLYAKKLINTKNK